MKQKIVWWLTVGSHWPEKLYEGQITLPVGGEFISKTMEFETDGKDALGDAEKALRKEMGDKEYHIWYWYSIHD